MKRLTTMICLALLALCTFAETKVIEKSAKKAPEWLYSAADGFIVVTVEASNLGEAQQRALQLVTERIILSVATSVSVNQNNEITSESTDGSVTEKESYKQVTRMKSANLPFLKGISSSRIKDIYWIKLQDKATKAEHYEYSVKYPYSKTEQLQLVDEFERLDASKDQEYETLKNNIDNIESVEQIKQSILQLNSLKEYFFDNVRLSQVDALTEQYKALYSSITLSGTLVEDGKYEIQMLLDGKPVKVATVPKVTSNCASEIRVIPSGTKFVITYNAIDCLGDEENFIDVQFRINGKRVESKYHFKVDNE